MKEIIEKIKKLLALSESANQHEAELAARKAQELLSKHNLSIDEIELNASGTEAIDKERFEFRGTMKKWRHELFDFVAFSVDCEVIFHFQRRVIFAATVYGLEQNVQIAIYMYKYLENTINRLRKQYVKLNNSKCQETTGKPMAANKRYHIEKSYTLGVVNAVCKKLVEQKKSTPPTPGALVPVVNALVKKKVEEDCIIIRTMQERKSSTDGLAYKHGREDGSNITISKGVTHDNNGTQLAIEKKGK